MTKYNNWKKDLSDSAKAIRSIQHTVLPTLISGKLHSVESSGNALLLMMDQSCGIDYIREDNKGLQGVASRVQFGSDFRTFTIRAERHSGAKTELQKRLEQIKGGYFYPAFTMQAYFSSRNDLIMRSIAAIETISLYEFIEKYPEKVHRQCSDNVFIYCYWKDIKKAGYKINVRLGIDPLNPTP